jgi:AraC-like DNA-binding protein
VPAVAALLDSRAALGHLRRGLAREHRTVLAARSAAALERTLSTRIVDAIVVGPAAATRHEVEALPERFPGLPLLVYGMVRADDAATLLRWQQRGLREVVVEGVDDAVVGELVVRHGCLARRLQALQGAPRMLRLTEPIQLRAWALLLEAAGAPWTTAEVAGHLGVSREHLSRQFGAGGAPNLKRVIDFLRVVLVAELAANPGLDGGKLAALTGFSTPAQLRGMVRRITGASLAGVAGAAPDALLQRFVRVGGRSRGGG